MRQKHGGQVLVYTEFTELYGFFRYLDQINVQY